VCHSAREENQLWRLKIAYEEQYTHNSYEVNDHYDATTNIRSALFAYNKLHNPEKNTS